MSAPGPAPLGRSVIVTAGHAPPPAWADAPTVTLDDDALDEPAGLVSVLHDSWLARRPVVIRLAVDPAEFRTPESWAVDPWTLDPSFEPWSDRLHFLVWTNAYDARDPTVPPVWWWARKAERLGATPSTDPAAPGDVVLPDGTPAWIDGGPRAPLDAADLGAAVVHAETVELGHLTPQPAPRPPSADLAPDQLAAVAHATGPARVIAPAGSGKTRVLTERLRHLIADRGFEREAVLAVAYNKKAQLQLEERTVDVRPRALTLNALGLRIVAEARGATPTVIGEREVRRIVEDLVPRGRRLANTDRIGPYLEALAAVRLGLRGPEEVEDERDDVPGFADAFVPYRARLAAAGALDFDEQITTAIEVLLRDGGFRRHMQARFRHLLVDEFQDLTPAHVLLVRLLATPQLDVFGVGDDDQVIYGHAGASPDFLIHFDRLFPGAASHPLEVNYRCPAAVVDAARHLLDYNDVRVEKAIRSGPQADARDDALVVRSHDPEGGATALVETVTEWIASSDVSPSDVAVLTRVNSLLLAPHVALAEAGLPIDSVVRPDVLDRTGVRAALAYLRIGADPSGIDPADVAEVYRRPSRGLPQWFTKWLRGRMTLDRLDGIADRLDDAKVALKVRDLVADLRLVADAAAEGTTRDVLAVVKNEIGLGGAMGMLDASRAGDGGSSHLDDLEALEQVAALHASPGSFEMWLRASFHQEATPGGITLSTIHRVKGREWTHVALFGASAGLVPHRLATDVEEERRVFHVGITRGMRQVTIVTDASRPSPFLGELDGSAPRRRQEPPTPSPRTPAASRGRAPAATLDGLETALPPEAEALLDALRTWRLERSRSDGVPAYVVLNDKYLRGVAVAAPRSLPDLLALPGIGPTKLDLYGDEILEIIERAAG